MCVGGGRGVRGQEEEKERERNFHITELPWS